MADGAATWGDAESLKNTFTFRDSDVIVNTYPYNGSVTVQHLILTVLYDGSVEPIGNLRDDSPCLEMSGGGPGGHGPAAETGKGLFGKGKGKGKGKEKKGKDKDDNAKAGGDKKAWMGGASAFRSAEELNAWNGQTEKGPGPGRRILKTHRPPSSTVWIGGTDVFGADKAKMIVVTSTPMEALAKMCVKEQEWKKVDFNQKWVESWTRGKEGLLNMDWWTWHEEWWLAAKSNPGIITMCLEDLVSEPLPTLRKLVDQLGIKASDEVLNKSIKNSFPETCEKIDAWQNVLTPSHVKYVVDLHSQSSATKHCPFDSGNWTKMFAAQSQLADVREVELVPAHADAVEMRVTTNKGIGFYVKAASSFLQGVEAKPAKEGKDAIEAKPAKEHVRIAGLGDACGVAVATATAVETANLGSVTRIQTDYPNMEGSGRGCARICIDMIRK